MTDQRAFKCPAIQTFSILLSVILFAFIALFPHITVAAETNFRLAHMFARGSLPDLTAHKFAALLAEKSNGQLIVTVYPSGYFGDERKNLLLLQQGKLDFAITGDLFISFLKPEFSIINMPFIYRNPDHALAVYNSPIGQKLIKSMTESYQLRPLSWHYVGTRMLTANKPIKDIAALKGLSLRLPNDQVWKKTWSALGAITKPIAFPDLYMALKRGQVNAQENPPNFIRAQKFYEVQKYLINTNHMPQRQFIFSGTNIFDAQTAADQEIITAAAKETSDWASKQAKLSHEEDLQWLLTEGGMTLVEINLDGLSSYLDNVPSSIANGQGDAFLATIKAIQ